MSFRIQRTVPKGTVFGLFRRIFDPAPAKRIAITEDELFEILADSRRRAVIDHLADADRSATLSRSELARLIAADETHQTPEHVLDERIEPIDVELDRTHLPMLDEAGIVRWSAVDGEVAPGPSIDPIAEWLRTMERHVDPVPVRQRIRRIDAADPTWR